MTMYDCQTWNAACLVLDELLKEASDEGMDYPTLHRAAVHQLAERYDELSANDAKKVTRQVLDCFLDFGGSQPIRLRLAPDKTLLSEDPRDRTLPEGFKPKKVDENVPLDVRFSTRGIEDV